MVAVKVKGGVLCMTREQAGQKPVDKLMVADVEKTIIDEVGKMVKDETN